jgi:hypothetical protein
MLFIFKKSKKKYIGMRKSPDESATKLPDGMQKTGNDGNTWKISQDKNGRKRWVKLTEIKPNKMIKHKSHALEFTSWDGGYAVCCL